MILATALKPVERALATACKGAGRGVPRFKGTADDSSGSARYGTMGDGQRAVQRAAARTTDGAAGGGTDGR